MSSAKNSQPLVFRNFSRGCFTMASNTTSSLVRSLGGLCDAPTDSVETDHRRHGAPLERRFEGGPQLFVSDLEGMGHAQIGADGDAIEDDETVARGGRAGGADRAAGAGGPRAIAGKP